MSFIAGILGDHENAAAAEDGLLFVWMWTGWKAMQTDDEVACEIATGCIARLYPSERKTEA